MHNMHIQKNMRTRKIAFTDGDVECTGTTGSIESIIYRIPIGCSIYIFDQCKGSFYYRDKVLQATTTLMWDRLYSNACNRYHRFANCGWDQPHVSEHLRGLNNSLDCIRRNN